MRQLLLGLALLTGLLAQPADASQKSYVYKGALASGVDELGIFSSAGSDLTGVSVMLKFILDSGLNDANKNPDAHAGAFYYYGDDGSYAGVYGGSYGEGYLAPVTGSVFINGIEVILSTPNHGYGEADFRNNQAPYALDSILTTTGSGGLLSNGDTYIYGASGDISSTRDIIGPGVDQKGIYLKTSYGEQSYVTSFILQHFKNGSLIGTTKANFSPTIFAIGGVPEPSTWAMMIVGFGAIGIALRRRRRSLPAFQS